METVPPETSNTAPYPRAGWAEGSAAAELEQAATRVAAVRARMAAAAERAERAPEAVRLIAVSKNAGVAETAAVLAAGVSDLGESRVQLAMAKQSAMDRPARWHLIGHLQANKSARAAAAFSVIHSVDGGRVAAGLARHRDPAAGPLEVLIELEFTGIPGRSGIREAGAEALLREVATHPLLAITGLMTIAPPGDGAEAARPWFRRLHDLRERLRESTGIPLPELSMGMSGDFEVAIEEGATMVRVGTALFG